MYFDIQVTRWLYTCTSK